MYNPYSLEGKTILVTGASSGIGKTTAIECSKLGAKVVITARNEERLSETLNQLEGEGHQMLLADFSDFQQVEELAKNVPLLDGVCSNAGLNIMSPIPFYKVRDIEETFKVNTISPMVLVKMLAKNKKIQKNASIVFTSSIANVYCAGIANGIYGASKSALDGFMRTAALELASKGIRCNSVNPGMIETNMTTGLDGMISKEQYEIEKKKYPLGRFGQTIDVAHAIVFLLSDASSWMTGVALKIDGGLTI